MLDEIKYGQNNGGPRAPTGLVSEIIRGFPEVPETPLDPAL